MRLRDLIMIEDDASGATAGATTSADIATVSYPLMVKGRNRREKRRNARAAVGQGVFNEHAPVEPDAHGYPVDILTTPKYTVVVDTPGDLDWYKIGNYWNNKISDPHEFGQSDSDTVLVAQGETEYKEMINKLDKMGLIYKVIGGGTTQPEIHDKV